MTSPVIEIRGLEEIRQRMRQYPQKLRAAMKAAMEAALLVLWENVPPYPPQPEGSTYDRTGTLGRTLGSSEGGGKTGGGADVYEVRSVGSQGWEGRFGTSLDYAPHVIGDDTQAAQNAHWWTIKVVAERAKEKVLRLFDLLGQKMAQFLDGQR